MGLLVIAGNEVALYIDDECSSALQRAAYAKAKTAPDPNTIIASIRDRTINQADRELAGISR